VVVQLLSSLQHMNRCGYIHTDVKPHNLLVVQNSGCKYYSIKLADFGCAIRSDHSGAVEWGTSYYMAPEHFMDTFGGQSQSCAASTANASLDTWAVGVTLVETLLGYALNYVVESPGHLLHVHSQQQFFKWMKNELTMTVPDLDPSWLSVLCQMLQYHPSARPSPGQMLMLLLCDPAFEEHRQEMFSNVNSPEEAQLMVRSAESRVQSRSFSIPSSIGRQQSPKYGVAPDVLFMIEEQSPLSHAVCIAFGAVFAPSNCP
jgi:serine/threonine protein kinase